MKAVMIKKEKSLEEIKAFFSRESMYRVMKGTLSFLLSGRDIEFILMIGGGSYTDSIKLVIGLPKQMFGATYEEMYTVIIALLGHESQHVLSSNFKAFEIYNKEETEKLVKEGMSRRFASHFVHAIGNIIEDGRIEIILVNRLPGYIPKIQFLNMYFWNLNEMTKETNELHALTSTILSLATLGIYPKGYKKVFTGTKLDVEINKIKPLIEAGIKARKCEDGLNICRKIIAILKPYLFELYEEVRNEEKMMEQIMEFLKDLIDDFHNSEEIELNENQTHSSHIQIPDVNNEKNNDKSNNSEGSAQGSSSENESGSGKENFSGTGDSQANEKEGTEKSKEGKGKKESSNTDSNNGEVDSKNDREEGNDSNKSKETNKDLGTEPTELSGGVGTSMVEIDALTEDFISEKMEEIADGLFDEARDKFKEAAMEEKKNPVIKDSPALTEEEKLEMEERYKGYAFTEHPNDFPLIHTLPPEIKTPAKRFRKDIEKIFQNKSRLNAHGQHKGVLNVEDLYRVGLGEYNIFTVEGNKSPSDYVVYVLQDGSGSMRGEKEVSSSYALSIIEEGLRDIVPFKITTYATWSGVEHYIVRNWNDKSKKNYAFNFLHHRSARGANEDGYTISVATRELMKRPEKDKILIILSDGLPPSIEDTKEAIKEARSKRIHVVGIMFGSEQFRKTNFPQYKEMYQKNIIATSPKNIPNKLTTVLKKILVR